MWIVLDYFRGNHYDSYAKIKKEVSEKQNIPDDVKMTGHFFNDIKTARKYASAMCLERNQVILLLYIDSERSKIVIPTVETTIYNAT